MRVAIFLVCLNICSAAFTQSSDLYLDLPQAMSIADKNVYCFMVSPYIESKIQEISGEKIVIPSVEITYNGVPINTKSCKIRGHSTLYFKRKSFSISLQSGADRGQRWSPAIDRMAGAFTLV